MTNHDRTVDGDESLDPLVERATMLLRRPEVVRAAWREELLARVPVATPVRRSATRVWIPLAIAASLCTAVGIERLSARAGGDRVRFSVSAPSAKQVSLVGDFDRWNPSAVPMRRGSNDVWIVDVRLRPGRHVFAFAIDGALRADATAPRAVEDDFGVPGSVIVVSERGSD
jgi:predicted carbohydrate-binding protein with CBM48